MITKEWLQEFVQANPKLVQRNTSARYPGLYVIKYKKNVFWDNLWDDVLVECRGLVVDEDWNIVVQPFTKIFNRHENNTDIDLDAEVVAVRKVNGFMAAATYVEGYGVVVSTTGSLDSEFVDIAERWITPEVKGAIELDGRDMTFMFEICDPYDPHIVEETAGAYLLGGRVLPARGDYMSSAEHEQWLDQAAASMGVLRPEWSVARFSDVVASAKTCQHEGFVVYSQDCALKIKSPYYLALKAAARKKDIMSLNKQFVDEEFYDLIDHLTLNQESFNVLDEQARLDYMRKFLEI